MSQNAEITIGDIARRTGVAVSKIRFYADEALIPSMRTEGGTRVFHRAVIRRVSFILIAQQLGYSLTQIKTALASLPGNRTPTKTDWDKLSRRFSRDIDERIAKLQKLKDSLSGCIGCGCLSLQKCRLYNPEDRIEHRGPGPRYLMGDSSDDL